MSDNEQIFSFRAQNSGPCKPLTIHCSVVYIVLGRFTLSQFMGMPYIATFSLFPGDMQCNIWYMCVNKSSFYLLYGTKHFLITCCV